MASISTDPNGNRTIQFIGEGKKRHSIRLGKASMDTAEEVARYVEKLNQARKHGIPIEPETARWLKEEVHGDFYQKLVKVGLVQSRSVPPTLDAFIDWYIATRTDVKPATKTIMEHAQARLKDFFQGEEQERPDVLVCDVTKGDADRFVIKLRADYATATVTRIMKRARQFFSAAVRNGLIQENPFIDIKLGSTRNPSRLFYVTAETTQKLIEAAPDADWRAIIALCRFGGLRCPSEVLALTWNDIDWERGRFLVRASKTEHHEGGGLRWVPLFPELRPHLEALFDTPEPALYVINRYRSPAQNLRTTFLKIIHRAGLLKWPRLMQNLRASRQTELSARFPGHVVTAWIGNSEDVAAAHYLSVRDEDFDEALKPAPGSALHIPVQYPPESECKEGKRKAGFSGDFIGLHPAAPPSSGPGGTRTHTPFGTGS
jgi:integrase